MASSAPASADAAARARRIHRISSTLLAQEERAYFYRCLGLYTRSRNVDALGMDLRGLLGPASRQLLLGAVLQALPAHHRPPFARFFPPAAVAEAERPLTDTELNAALFALRRSSGTVSDPRQHRVGSGGSSGSAGHLRVGPPDSDGPRGARSASMHVESSAHAAARNAAHTHRNRQQRSAPSSIHSNTKIFGAAPSAPTRQLVLERTPAGLGLNIRGGREYGTGIIISRVDDGGAAEKAGLQPGDQLLQVNNVSLVNVTHRQAVQILSQAATLRLLVAHIGVIPGMDGAPSAGAARPSISSLPVQASSPALLVTGPSSSSLPAPAPKHPAGPSAVATETVMVTAGPAGLGFSIRGGAEFGLAIIVSSVDMDGPAEMVGLKPGDRLLSVDDVSLADVTHTRAVELLTARDTVSVTFASGNTAPPDARYFRDELAAAPPAAHPPSTAKAEEADFFETLRESLWDVKIAQLLGSEQAAAVQQSVAGYEARRCSVADLVASLQINSDSALVFSQLAEELRLLVRVDDIGEYDRLVEDGKRAKAACAPPTIAEEDCADEGDEAAPASPSQAAAPAEPQTPAPAPAGSSDGAPDLEMETPVPLRDHRISRLLSERRSSRLSYIDADSSAAVETPLYRRSLAEQPDSGRGAAAAAAPARIDLSDAYLAGRSVHDVKIAKGGAPLGLTLEGGADTEQPNLGVRVRAIRKGGGVDLDGRLRVGDEILAVDGEALQGKTHDQAVAAVVKALQADTAVIEFKFARA